MYDSFLNDEARDSERSSKDEKISLYQAYIFTDRTLPFNDILRKGDYSRGGDRSNGCKQ